MDGPVFRMLCVLVSCVSSIFNFLSREFSFLGHMIPFRITTVTQPITSFDAGSFFHLLKLLRGFEWGERQGYFSSHTNLHYF